MSDRKCRTVTVRMTKQQHAWLQEEAHKERTSMNQLVLSRVMRSSIRDARSPCCCELPEVQVSFSATTPEQLQHCEALGRAAG